MARLAIIALVVGCTPSSPPPSIVPVIPTATTTCFAGVSTGMGQRTHTIARRIVDPKARQIIEDVTHGDDGVHGAKSFHVVMAVDGDRFTMTETGGAFTGSGTLVGQPWDWQSWASVSAIPDTPITVESRDELTPTGMTATKSIKQSGRVVATTTDRLEAFDCSRWDASKLELTVGKADRPTCERACRNYATLKYWQQHDNPDAAVRAQQAQELATKIEAGLDTCTSGCVDSHNAAQTACIIAATSVEQLAACDADR